MKNGNAIEKLFWSIALPGFGQFLNGHFAKGVVFIFLEILINVKANLNNVIVSSFYGNIEESIAQTNYGWLMFYPCIYIFSIWDAYRNAAEEVTSLSFLPFILSAYFGTIGVIYSPTLKIFEFLLGPIWLSIVFIFLGCFLGISLKVFIKRIFN